MDRRTGRRRILLSRLHSMNKPKLIVVIGVITMNMLVLLFLPKAARWEQCVSLTLAGYTNSPSGNRLATLVLSNRGSSPIRRFPVCEVVAQPSDLVGQSPFPGWLYLRPGESNVFCIPAPDTRRPWMALLLVSRMGWRGRLCDWADQHPRLRAIVPMKWRGVPAEHIQTEWITE